MAVVTMILGESGTGKSTSMRNLDPKKVLLIQSIKKPLPFHSKNWLPKAKGDDDSTVWVNDNSEQICKMLDHLPEQKEIVIIDDFQYVMANEFMRGVTDEAKGNDAFMKYNRIAQNAWNILNAINALPDGKRVYLMSHTQTDDLGKTKIKTIGKLLDEKITLEGMVSIVLKTHVINGHYTFNTQNSGHDTVKSPMGMFADNQIDNDLLMVDDTICDYYGISQPQLTETNEEEAIND